jgi:hypothetical protein
LVPVLAHSRRCLCAPRAEDLQVALVGQLGVGDRHPASQRTQQGLFPRPGRLRRQPLGDQGIERGVDAADEEAGHAGHAGRIAAAVDQALQTIDVGLGDLTVDVAVEQQGDIDVDAFADQLLDGRNARRRRRDLDHQVVPADRAPQTAGLGQRAGGVHGQQRRHFQADVPIPPRAVAIHRPQGIGRVPDVPHRQAFVQALGVHPPRLRRCEEVAVVRAASDSLLEDRRIGRHPGQSVLLDQAVQLAAGDQTAANVVQPDGLTEHLQGAQRILQRRHLGQPPQVAGLAAEARVEEGVNQLARQLDPDHPSAQHQHVHVVVLHPLMGGIGVVAQAGPHAWDPVRRHRRPDPAAAQDDAPFSAVPLQGRPDRLGIVRVVDGIAAAGAHVQHLAVLGEQERLGRFFQVEAGVIGSDGYPHGQSGQVQSVISLRSVPCSWA